MAALCAQLRATHPTRAYHARVVEEEHVYKAVKLRSNTLNSASAQNIVMLESP